MATPKADDWKTMGFKSPADFSQWLAQAQFTMQDRKEGAMADKNAAATKGPITNSAWPDRAEKRKSGLFGITGR